jgi:hypothetical protein
MYWAHPCCTLIDMSSSIVRPLCDCPRSINGLRQLKRVASWVMGQDLSKCFVNELRWSRKVLRGVNPGDLAVEQPTNFKLVVNLKTAKAMNYEVPAGLVLRADEVIE